MNLGNTGQRGYKMSKVTAISSDSTQVLLTLECGHVMRWYPYGGSTPAQYAQQIQGSISPIVVNQTRLRCKERHE